MADRSSGSASFLRYALLATVVTLLSLNAYLMWQVLKVSKTPLSATASAPSSATPRHNQGGAVQARGNLAEAEKTTVEIFRKSAPSVVYITTLAVRQDPFRRNIMEIPQGTGSGFVWDDAGHVVTNFHVIQGAQAARVTLHNQSAWRAKLVGAAPDKDLAVLRIENPDNALEPLTVGQSNNLVVGQHVFAIGNPFGFDHTLSTGVISGLNREIMSASRRPIQGVVQTDAAINPGNSGGPLLDSAGRLIGVNTAIYSPSGAYAGIGFAVPVDTVRRIIPQLIKHGRVIKPGLGIQIAEDSLSKRLGVEGVLIMGVMPRSPAKEAKLQAVRRHPMTGAVVLGDIIVGMDGEAIKTTLDLYRVLDRKKVGQIVTLKIKRGSDTLNKDIKLAPLPD